MKRQPFKRFFEISMEMHFVSLFFLNERNISNSFLKIHSKCTVVPYSHLNSTSINKPFLNYGPLNMLFRFFRFFLFILTRLLTKTWKNYHFLKQISTIHLKGKSITECSDVKPCRHFEYKAKFEKRSPLFRSKIGPFDIYFERLCEEIFEDLEIKSN